MRKKNYCDIAKDNTRKNYCDIAKGNAQKKYYDIAKVLLKNRLKR